MGIREHGRGFARRGDEQRLSDSIDALQIEPSESTLFGQQDEVLGVLRLPVSARDADGNRTAAPPPDCVKLIVLPSGGQESSQFAVDYEVSETDPYVGIITLKSTGLSREDVLPGMYEVLLVAGELQETVLFTVSGPPDTLSIECDALPNEIENGAVVTATATVTDRAGNPVADGTEVNFSTGGTLTLERIGVDEPVATVRGVAEAQYVIRSDAGSAMIIAAARAASGIAWVAGDDESGIEKGSASGFRSIQAGFASWQARDNAMASEVFDDIAKHGIVALQLWNDRDGEGFWERYAKVGGQRIPGSVDFEIRLGDVLYLSG